MLNRNENTLRAPFPHPADWKVRKLRDVCSKIGSGATPTGGQANYLPIKENWALVRSQNVFDRRFDETGLAYITDEQAAALGGVVLQSGDVLLNITGDGVTFARSCQIPESTLPAVVNQHVSIVRPKPDLLNPGFLLAYLTHPEVKQYIEGFNAGGSRRAITKGHIESFNIPLPPIQVQEDIALILGTLDDKIELNHRTNETLEAMARAIFKSWFVDFDPVRAKASGEPPESIFRRLGLTPDLLALFPNRFQDSELGEIPAGWKLKQFPEIIEVNPTRALKKGVEAPYLDMANMPTASARAHEVITREFGSGMKFKNGDTLVARITPCLENGKTCFVDFLADEQIGWGSTEYIVLLPKAPLPPEYAYFLARTDLFRNHAIANMTGTSGRQRVPVNAFDKVWLVMPQKELANIFGRLSQSIMESMRVRDAESKTLADQRDMLLPKLLSGDVIAPSISAPVLLAEA